MGLYGAEKIEREEARSRCPKCALAAIHLREEVETFNFNVRLEICILVFQLQECGALSLKQEIRWFFIVAEFHLRSNSSVESHASSLSKIARLEQLE